MTPLMVTTFSISIFAAGEAVLLRPLEGVFFFGFAGALALLFEAGAAASVAGADAGALDGAAADSTDAGPVEAGAAGGT